MTEQEWLASDDPMRMLGMHSGPDYRPWSRPKYMEGVSDRKLRLFACAVSRLHPRSEEVKAFGDGHIAESLAACNVAERWADGELSRDEAKRLEGHCWIVMSDLPHVAARLMADYPRRTALTASLLRTIVGNPWRPVTLPTVGPPKRLVQCPHCRLTGRHCYLCHGTTKVLVACEHCFDEKTIYLGMDNLKRMPCIKCPKPTCPWLTHADGTVPKLAQVIYDERRWSAMGMLADALEEAGCEDEAILRWCRGLVLSPVEPGDSLKIVDDPLRLIHFDETGIIAATVVSVKGSEMTVQPSNAAIGDYGVWTTAFKWIPRRGPSVRGDWCLDLLLGRE